MDDRDGSDFEQALLQADRATATRIARSVPPGGMADELLVPALERIGAAFERGDVALSQVYLAGRLCEALLDEVPATPTDDAAPRPKIGVAVLEDHHVLGKRMVLSVLRAAGWSPVDLGHGMRVAELARRAREERLEVLLVSVLMLRAALRVKELVAALAADGGPPLPVIVGGAPFRLDPELAREVAATAVGRTAGEAPALVAHTLARKEAQP